MFLLNEQLQDCHVLKLRTNDIANGPGIRVSLWVAGCIHHCKGCHNPDTWKWKQGVPLSKDLILKIFKECSKPHIRGLTLTGGDPLFTKNYQGIYLLCKEFKNYFGSYKDIWLWTGSSWEDIKGLEIFKENLVDVVVDGKFLIDQKDPTLPYSGSKNQRVILISQSHNGAIKCL